MFRGRMAARAFTGILLALFLDWRPTMVTAADLPGRITGIGGIFVVSKDPKALAAWYRDVLGFPLEAWGGTIFRRDRTTPSPAAAWNVVQDKAHYLAPSKRDFMIDFVVDDLTALIVRLKAKGVAILKENDTDPSGQFAWILDPDGTKIEFWQPKK